MSKQQPYTAYKLTLSRQPQMAATKARIGFLSLSAALRNTIYWLVMEPDPDIKEEEEMYSWEDNGPVLVIQSPYIDRYGYDPDCYTKWWFQPNITKVSRQLRKEALAMFYGNIEFRAYGSNCEEMLVAAQERLRHIGKDAKLIKHFHVLYETTRHHEDRDLKSDVIADLYPIPPSSIKVMVEAEHGAIRGAGVVETVRGYIDL